MAKILMINPVVREEDNPKHIPYGLAILASIAIEAGHQVQMYDANAWRKGDDILTQACAADEWDIIAIGGLTTSYGYIKKTCAIAKEVAPQAFIIAGGGFLTSMPLDIMSWIPEIDLGVVGEAFVSWPEVLKKVDNKDFNFKQTMGVCFRLPDGRPVLTGTRPNIVDLDVLPWPAWDLFPLDIYFQNSQLLFSEEVFTSKRRIDVNGSLGCGLICKYCWHLGTTGDMVIEPNEDGVNDVRFTYGRNIRYHSADYIVSMVKHLHDKYDVDFASFIDENFMTMNAHSGGTWLEEVCNKWIEAGLQPTCRRDGVPHDENCTGVHWGGTSHAGLHNPDVLAKMYEAGCSNLVYGLETFSPKILKTLGKGSTKKRNMDSVKMCLDSGIKPIPNIIIGFPDEDFDTVRETIDALKALGIKAKPHFATAYPGSEWYYTYKDSILEQYDGDLEAYILDLGDASKITASISHKFSGMQLLGLQQLVYYQDSRQLDLAEKHWNTADEKTYPLAAPKQSFNIVRKKVKAPIETEVMPVVRDA